MMLHSVMASGSASPPLPPYNSKGNLPANKVVLLNADNEEEEEEKEKGDIIVVGKEASGPLTPQASKGKGK